MKGLDAGWIEGTPRLRFYRRRGKGLPLLFLHGVLRCAADFQEMLPFLHPGWDVFLVDQRGHGDSERAARYRVVDYIADAFRVVDFIGAGGLVVFGHSLGAMVATALAVARPLRAVVLEDPPFSTMGDRIVGSGWCALFFGMRRVLVAGGGVGEVFRGLGEILVPQQGGEMRALCTLRSEASLRWSAECLMRVDPGVLEPLVEGKWLEGWTWEGLLSKARSEVCLLRGDLAAGAALTPADASAVGRPKLGYRHEFFCGQGHQLHAANPASFAEMVNGWWEETAPGFYSE
jgi:pimeloyl-ACP methyl ester carboxylesterase